MSNSVKESNVKVMFSIFRISPIIRITLLTFYTALTLPLPFLAKASASPIPASFLWGGIALGGVLLYGLLGERTILDEEKIQVVYPQWFPGFLRQGWELKWTEIKNLKLRTTGQGGLVYYFVSHAEDRAYLLPARVAGFARLVRQVEEKTGIDTKDIRPMPQPWMYFILCAIALLLLLVDFWTIGTALSLG
ncbi:hypothetical protein IQ249_09905 [Lusitaniella coriacea LEGE 07157]|uniref:Uncharacterized protein n=1 Tax=Lusitaniella coriacea LEGE 07157 TaxID=945747 RepID=A0A8J7J278_9CYAN|nr:hypothetical protein [Lusitaniella coriacea]MBE9116209.1 hypothetical protein [Lusitaniella coriacea LEGE 07157]